jgi:hypothetical protein
MHAGRTVGVALGPLSKLPYPIYSSSLDPPYTADPGYIHTAPHNLHATHSMSSPAFLIEQNNPPRNAVRSSHHQHARHQAAYALLPPAVTMSLVGEKLKMAPSCAFPASCQRRVSCAYGYVRAVQAWELKAGLTSIGCHVIVGKGIAQSINVGGVDDSSVMLQAR